MRVSSALVDVVSGCGVGTRIFRGYFGRYAARQCCPWRISALSLRASPGARGLATLPVWRASHESFVGLDPGLRRERVSFGYASSFGSLLMGVVHWKRASWHAAPAEAGVQAFWKVAEGFDWTLWIEGIVCFARFSGSGWIPAFAGKAWLCHASSSWTSDGVS